MAVARASPELVTFDGLEHVMGARHWMSDEECRQWILRAEDSAQLSNVHQAATREMAHRVHKRMQFESEEIALELFKRVVHFVPPTLDGLTPVGCSSNIRLYKYDRGDSFGPHFDESIPSPDGTISKFTMLVYLNTVKAGDGGQTIFYADHRAKKVACSVQPKCGFLLLHGHGDRCLTHEAEELRSGFKYVLRTDVMYGNRNIQGGRSKRKGRC